MNDTQMTRQRDISRVLTAVQLMLAWGLFPEDILARLEAVLVDVDLSALAGVLPAGSVGGEVSGRNRGPKT
ncbi:MAG: hypothetical protein ACHQ0J_10480 [Candidatus Dormibacterales bacterium]